MRAPCAAFVSDSESGRSPCRLFQYDCDYDDRSVHCRWRNLPDRSGQDDRKQGDGSLRQQRDQTVSSGHAGYRRHRSLCEQYGNCGAYAPYHCEYGCRCRQVAPQVSDASGICQQHGRHDDPYRYPAQPYRERYSPKCRISAAFVLCLPSRRSDSTGSGCHISVAGNKDAYSEGKGSGQEDGKVSQGTCQGIWHFIDTFQGAYQG